jgi:Uncharacterized conserved protein
MSEVALIRCENYEYDSVKAAVRRGIDLLGGAGAFVKAGEKILLKPNFLSGDPPERCVTTHPAVFKAVAEIMKEAGAKLSYGDSPGFQTAASAAKGTGVGAVAEELGIELADFRNGREAFFKEGIQNKKFTIAAGILDSDGVISLPKMKTHAFMRMTGAVKNQFGCIPGRKKSEFHVRTPNAADFARMLVDLNSCVRPRLYIIDGICAMEGNGPRGGTPRQMNVMIFSRDPVAADAVICRLMNLDPNLVLTIKAGEEAGAGESKGIRLLGDGIEQFIAKDYKVNREPLKTFKRGRFTAVKNLIVPRPYILEEKCVRCGVCAGACPVEPKALDWHDGNKKNPPSYKYERCIRCYCCQEMCPESAIRLRKPIISRIFGK